MDNNLQKLSKIETLNVAKALIDHYLSDTPPPDKVTVFKNTIARYTDDPGYFHATVKIEVDYGPNPPKSHKIAIKFKMAGGRIVGNSISYI